MSNTALVSVIVIFLNEEKFIQEAIESVLAQTYDNWELLFVNDGSSDRSAEIVHSYVQQDSQRLHYLEHEGGQNLGMSASRNLGIQQAQGEYIAFIDADDVWLPQKLQQQVELIESQPDAALVCGRTQWWYSWTGEEADQHRDFLQELDFPLNNLVKPPELLLLFLQNEWATLHDILVRREAVAAVDGYENSFSGMYEDQVFHAKLCLKFSAYVADQLWCRYRQHDKSMTYISHNMENGYHKTRKTFLTWLESYLRQQRAENTEVWQVLQKHLWHYRYPLLSRIMNRLQRLKQNSKQLVKLTVRSNQK